MLEAGLEALDIEEPICFKTSRLVEAGLDTGLDGFCIVKTIDFATFLKCQGPSRPASRRASMSFALKNNSFEAIEARGDSGLYNTKRRVTGSLEPPSRRSWALNQA